MTKWTDVLGTNKLGDGVDLHLKHVREGKPAIGCVDNFKDNLTPQLLFWDLLHDEPVVKLLYSENGRLTVIVHRDMEVNAASHRRGFHSDWDHVAKLQGQIDADQENGTITCRCPHLIGSTEIMVQVRVSVEKGTILAVLDRENAPHRPGITQDVIEAFTEQAELEFSGGAPVKQLAVRIAFENLGTAAYEETKNLGRADKGYGKRAALLHPFVDDDDVQCYGLVFYEEDNDNAERRKPKHWIRLPHHKRHLEIGTSELSSHHFFVIADEKTWDELVDKCRNEVTQEPKKKGKGKKK
jgi:hypothetical protein